MVTFGFLEIDMATSVQSREMHCKGNTHCMAICIHCRCFFHRAALYGHTIMRVFNIVQPPGCTVEVIPTVRTPGRTVEVIPTVRTPGRTVEVIPTVRTPIRTVEVIPTVRTPGRTVEVIPTVRTPGHTVEVIPTVRTPGRSVEVIPTVRLSSQCWLPQPPQDVAMSEKLFYRHFFYFCQVQIV